MGACGRTSPNPEVGCVVVDGSGNLVAQGATAFWGGAHAEAQALKSYFLSHPVPDSLDVYVTLEPCSHHGKQPPCAELFRHPAIKRVFVATADPDTKVDGRGLALMRSFGKEVHLGLLKKEVRSWLLPFFVNRTWNRPLVALKWAQTLNGALHRSDGTSQWISSPASRHYTHWLRMRYDAIFVGAGTLLADFPRLSVRLPTHDSLVQPVKIIWDPSLRIAKVKQEISLRFLEQTFSSPNSAVIVTTEALWNQPWQDALLKKDLEQNQQIFFCDNTLLNREQINSILGSEQAYRCRGRPLQSVLIEGGPTVHAHCYQQQIADVIHCFIGAEIFAQADCEQNTGKIVLNYEDCLKQKCAEKQAPFSFLYSHQFENDLLVELAHKEVVSKILN